MSEFWLIVTVSYSPFELARLRWLAKQFQLNDARREAA